MLIFFIFTNHMFREWVFPSNYGCLFREPTVNGGSKGDDASILRPSGYHGFVLRNYFYFSVIFERLCPFKGFRSKRFLRLLQHRMRTIYQGVRVCNTVRSTRYPHFSVASTKLNELNVVGSGHSLLPLASRRMGHFSYFQFPLSFPLHFHCKCIRHCMVPIVGIPVRFSHHQRLVFLSIGGNKAMVHPYPCRGNGFGGNDSRSRGRAMLSVRNTPLLPPFSFPTIQAEAPVSPRILPTTSPIMRSSFPISTLSSSQRKRKGSNDARWRRPHQ